MGVPFKMAQPMIPGGLLHTMYEVQAGGHYDQDKGGQWVLSVRGLCGRRQRGRHRR